MKKQILLVVVAFIALAGITNAQEAKSVDKKLVAHKVIIQLSNNDQQQWSFLMNNLRFLKQGFGESATIEVVCYGPGIDIITKGTSQQEKIAEFKKAGVSFVGCENTMKSKGLKKEDLIAEAGTVPSGVGELVLKQEQGWSYIKAGY